MAKATIRDVARASGVGLSTVSRVVNGNYPVNEQTRARVLKAIAELGYVPDAAARSMKTNRTLLVGIVVPDISNASMMQAVRGAERVLAAAGYALMIASSEDNAAGEQRILGDFFSRKVDAVILATCQTDAAYFRRLQTDAPLVFMERGVPGLEADLVAEDHETAAETLTEMLLANGHRRIALVNGGPHIPAAQRRQDGFVRALRAHGLAPEPRYVIRANTAGSARALRDLFTSLPGDAWPTAVFATNNRRAEVVVSTLESLGLRIPDDISVVSYGNANLGENHALRLTYVDQEPAELGRLAGELVLKRIRQGASGTTGPVRMSSEATIVSGNSHRRIAERV